MAPSSSSSSSIPSISPRHHPPPFTPIPECEREGNDYEECTEKGEVVDYRHHPTPLHQGRGSEKREKPPPARRRPDSDDDHEVSCNKCRPSNREKISVVPVDNGGNSSSSSHSLTSPNGLFKSIFSKKSPRPPDNSCSSSAAAAAREEQWRIAAAEVSHKLVQATRKRDEAILEASRLKYSMTELEKKLNKLETYCHSLKSGLDECASNNKPNGVKMDKALLNPVKVGNQFAVVEDFLVAVSEARSSVRVLSRSLTLQLRQMGTKVYDRIALLLQPYDIKISLSRNPRGLLFYLEALINMAFFEEFESLGFQKNVPTRILNPIDRCETNFTSFCDLRSLTWEDVLNKGTRHFSEEFSKFCDRKMSEIVAMLGWNRAWPEPLLQTFFGAAKWVWLVHLLANSVHPGLPIFRVDKGVKFDPVYMEDVGSGDRRARKLVPTVVRMMVAPGFYVYGNVVKCKVLSRYHNLNGSVTELEEKGLTPSPT